MPRSLWEDAARRETLERLRGLTRDTRPRWGAMTAGVMLAHLNDTCRLTLGELTGPPASRILRTAPVRWLVVNLLPMPRNVAAPPVLLTNTPGDFETDRASFGTLVDRCCARGDRDPWGESPLFGPLGRRDWGVLSYKHSDHHLRQFGL